MVPSAMNPIHLPTDILPTSLIQQILTNQSYLGAALGTRHRDRTPDLMELNILVSYQDLEGLGTAAAQKVSW